MEIRKLDEKVNPENKKKRNSIIAGIILLVIMALSTLGYAFLSNEKIVKDSGNSKTGQVFQNGKWLIEYNGEVFGFSNPKTEIENISVQTFAGIGDYVGQPLYISAEKEGIAWEIASVLGAYASRVQKACYGACELDLPEKKCDENLIVWNSSDIGRVYQNEKCIFIEGDMRAVDAFLYRVLGA